MYIQERSPLLSIGRTDRLEYHHGPFPYQDAVDFRSRMENLFYNPIIFRNFTMIRSTQGQPVRVHDRDIEFLLMTSHAISLNCSTKLEEKGRGCFLSAGQAVAKRPHFGHAADVV
jgi:hypothetical protein